MAVTVLDVDSVTKRYGPFRLGPVDLEVGEEVLAVLGPSGCGKTTLLSIVAGFVAPDAGRVRLGGRDLTGLPPQERRAVLVFQDGALFPHLTAQENIAYAGAHPTRVADLAATLEIGDVLDQPAPTLSGGQRQRVALARSLAADPDALLLDEPLSNLDAPIKRRLRDELSDLLASLRIPVVYVTHDQREATVVGDRVAVLGDGRVHQVGRPSAVFEHPATPFVASFTGAVNVFEATVSVVDADATVLDWGPHRIRAAPGVFTPGDRVRFSVRPEYVSAATPDTSEPPNDPEANVVLGQVARRVFEGDAYTVAVRPEGVDTDLVATLLPPGYARSGLADRDDARLAFSPSAVHLLETV